MKNQKGVVPIIAVGGGCIAIGCMTLAILMIMLVAVGSFSFFGDKGKSEASTEIDAGGTGGGDLANANALTEEQIKDLLTNKISYGYNLAPYSHQIWQACQIFHINPLFALAIANKDSSLGTAGAGRTCRNPGNMMNRSDKFSKSGVSSIGNCQEAYGGSARWAAFSTYGDGMQAKIWLLRAVYIDQGYDTIEKIIYRYAPPSENDTEQYIRDVKNFMEKYGNMYK